MWSGASVVSGFHEGRLSRVGFRFNVLTPSWRGETGHQVVEAIGFFHQMSNEKRTPGCLGYIYIHIYIYIEGMKSYPINVGIIINQ